MIKPIYLKPAHWHFHPILLVPSNSAQKGSKSGHFGGIHDTTPQVATYAMTPKSALFQNSTFCTFCKKVHIFMFFTFWLKKCSLMMELTSPIFAKPEISKKHEKHGFWRFLGVVQKPSLFALFPKKCTFWQNSRFCKKCVLNDGVDITDFSKTRNIQKTPKTRFLGVSKSVKFDQILTFLRGFGPPDHGFWTPSEHPFDPS